MIRTGTLLESEEVQRDHFWRCQKLAKSGKANPAELEIVSYTDVVGIIPTGLFGVEPSVLDVGCQSLAAYPYLKAKMSDMRYTGVEILPELVETMQKKYPDRKIVVGCAEELPFQDCSFDVIWARHVLEHVVDIDKTFDEFKRVLKPQGVIAFTVPTGVHGEPAHFLEIEKEDWQNIFHRNEFLVYSEGQHDFNLNEYYGVLSLDEIK